MVFSAYAMAKSSSSEITNQCLKNFVVSFERDSDNLLNKYKRLSKPEFSFVSRFSCDKLKKSFARLILNLKIEKKIASKSKVTGNNNLNILFLYDLLK